MKNKRLTIRNAWFPILTTALLTCAGITATHTLSAQAPVSPDATRIGLTPYLLLNGTCKQAMEFYQACLGGELTLTTVGDSPMKSAFPASMHDKVVNARLVSGNLVLSASDWLRPQETPVQGNTVCLYLDGGSYAELKEVFDRLSNGATVTDPLRHEPFGTYGALNDKFGIRWMFHAGKTD